MITAGPCYWLENDEVKKESRAVAVDAELFGQGVTALGLDAVRFKLDQIKGLAEAEHLKLHVANRTQVYHASFTLGKLESYYVATQDAEPLRKTLKQIQAAAIAVAKHQYLANLKNHKGEALKCVGLAYTHITSSKGDPQVHVHVEIFNVGVTEKGQHYSIRNARQEIFQKQHAAKAQFSLDMKNYFEKVHGLKVDKGDLVLSEAALQKALMKEFSSVKEQIRARVKELGTKLTPRDYSHILQGVHAANRRELPRVMGYLDVPAVQAGWKARAAGLGLESVALFKKVVRAPEVAREWEAYAAVQKAVKHQEERKLSFTRADLESRAFKAAEAMPETPTSREILQVVDKALQSRSFAGIKKIEAEVWQETGKGWDKQETRYHTRQSAERENARSWATWKEALKDATHEAKAVVKDLVVQAKESAKKAGVEFSLATYCATELPKQLTKYILDHTVTFEYSQTPSAKPKIGSKICVTISAEQVPYFLYRHSKTPYWQAHRRALWKAVTKGSLDRGSREFERERTPRERLHAGVIVVVQDPNGKVTDEHREALRRLAKRDGSKIVVESPVKVTVSKDQHQHEKGK